MRLVSATGFSPLRPLLWGFTRSLVDGLCDEVAARVGTVAGETYQNLTVRLRPTGPAASRHRVFVFAASAYCIKHTGGLIGRVITRMAARPCVGTRVYGHP